MTRCQVTGDRIQPFTQAIRENARTNSTSGIGCNYVNPRTSPVYLIAADRVLYIELREIPRLVFSVESQICDFDAHCTYTVSFHRGKWIDVKLQLLEVLAEFHTVVLTTPNLCTLAF